MDFRPSLQKPHALTQQEAAALRAVANKGEVRGRMLDRLKALGLIENKNGTWTATQQGYIQLMFAAAR